MTEETSLATVVSAATDEALDSLYPPISLSVQELSDIVQAFASSSEWLDQVKLRTDRRWYRRLHCGPEYDVWVLSWMPGQSTGFHDHGASAGAFVVTTGTLEEHRPGEPGTVVSAGQSRVFGPDYAHDVRNVSEAPAISIHAYSPPLNEMNEYELQDDRLVLREKEPRNPQISGDLRQMKPHDLKARTDVLSIDEVLAAARARIDRLSPSEAYRALRNGWAVLVDIRPERQRALEGSIPGALVVERNVLEWRFDPKCDARLPVASTYDLQVIVFCSEGYTSSLAAAALQELGLWRATDMTGGFKAWQSEGLPTA